MSLTIRNLQLFSFSLFFHKNNSSYTKRFTYQIYQINNNTLLYRIKGRKWFQKWRTCINQSLVKFFQTCLTKTVDNVSFWNLVIEHVRTVRCSSRLLWGEGLGYLRRGCLADTPLPPVDRMTDTCENITLPQLLCGR